LGAQFTLDAIEPDALGLRGGADTLLAHWVSGGDLFVSLADADGWSTPQALESSTFDARTPTSATLPSGFATSWSAGGGLYVARHQGAWGAPQDLIQEAHSGAALRPRVALTPAGQALAAWEQWHDGALGVYANSFDGEAWGAAFAVAWPARNPEIATAGSRFLIAYQRDAPESHAYARTWSAGALGAERQLDAETTGWAREPQLASDGRTFVAAWLAEGARAAGAWSEDGSAWAAPTSFSGQANRVQVSATPSAYVLAGSQETAVARVHAGSGWGDEVAIGDGYLFGSAASGDANAVVMIETGTYPYQALWAIYRAGAWSTGRLMPAGRRNGSIASDGAGFRVVFDGTPSYEGVWADGAWSVRTVGLHDLWQLASDGGSWGVATSASDLWYLLDGRWESGGSFSPGKGVVNAMRLTGAGGSYATVLEQGAPGETVIRAGAGM